MNLVEQIAPSEFAAARAFPAAGELSGIEPSSPASAKTAAFLKRVLPSRGVVVVVELGDNKPPRQHFCKTIDEAAARAIELDEQAKDVYFACATYETARNRRAENACAAKTFWLDVDVDPANPDKYPTQRVAIEALARVAGELKLPLPLLVKSGSGIHAYWPLKEAMAAAAWRPAAKRFKAVLEKLGFKQDPSRTADIASILRPVGTHWRKRGERLVECIHEGTPIDAEAFACALGEYESRLTGARIPHEYADRLNQPTADDLIAGTGGDPFAPYPYADNRTVFREALHVAFPTPKERAEWRIGLCALAFLHTGQHWPEPHVKALLDEWSALAPDVDKTHNDREWQDALKRTCERIATGDRSITTHLTILKRARDRGWDPTTVASAVPNWLADLNVRYAWIESVASIYRTEFRAYIEPQRFRLQEDIHQATVATGGGGTKSVGAGTAWLRHAGRRQHKAVVLRPGEPAVTHDNCLNQWQGFAVTPMRGDLKPFLALFRRLIPNTDARRYVIRWLAHLVQHPGVKMYVALVIWSVTQGVGKNLLFECLFAIIGTAHASIIGQRDLTGPFNASWAGAAIFVIGNEISSSAKRQDADALKGMLTDPRMWINGKYQPSYDIPNLINYVFLSNHPDAVFIEDQDRRFFVHEVSAPKLSPLEAQQFVTWRDRGGLSALLHFLLRVDIADFDPKAPAPMTAAKSEMIEDSRSDLERWLADLMKGSVAQLLGRELATAAELGRKYANENGRREPPSAKAVTTAAKRLGALARPNQVRLACGKKVRALALAQPAVWVSLSDAEWAAELDKPLKVN